MNMVFFQYWAAFFSTIFFVYTYISLLNLFGTLEYAIVNSLFLGQTQQLNHLTHSFVAVLLIFAFFLKLGVAPFQMFKAEIYNGIPFLSIFFYTVYYFLIFFTFFIFFLLHMFVGYLYYYSLVLILLLVCGITYIIALLFDITQLKVFLTYSTVLNSIGFLLLLLTNL